MSDILKVTNLVKHYDQFTLDHLNLNVPENSIVGFIGSNGAGKTTTIKATLGLISYDEGNIELLGNTVSPKNAPTAAKEKIGVVFDTLPFPTDCHLSDIAAIGKASYTTWDALSFKQLMQDFGLANTKDVKSLSRGMGMKLQLAFALAHHPILLILDEATAGLDPLARDEVLDLLREFMNEEHRGILLSSHITSDLEKIADYIVCIDKGKHIFTKPIDEICDLAGVVHCRSAEAEELLAKKIFDQGSLRILRGTYSTNILVPSRAQLTKAMPSIACDRINLEEYMRFMLKGEIK